MVNGIINVGHAKWQCIIMGNRLDISLKRDQKDNIS